ncbi:MAG: DUF1653 domain-containing protein [Clostridia bacterium]|nr:DUF1653 domain-containing protein [Clostridia bacterium]
MSKYLKCTTNKSPISYKCGEKIVFKIEAKNNSQPVEYVFIKWSVRCDDGKFMTDVFKFNNHEPLIIETTLDRPGYVHLYATVHMKDSYADPSFDVLEAGAGADIDKLEYCDTIPEDFDEYWADIERMVAEHTPEILYEREITEDVPKGFKAYDIRVSVPCDGRPASGILTYPDDGKKHPLRALFSGYAIAPARPEFRDNTVTFWINAHGIENELARVEAEVKYHKELSGYGMSETENASNMTTYWRNVMIRDLVGVKFAKSLPQWNGKGLTANGGSQGAFQATTVAAHDKDVTFLDINVPWFCNLNAENCGFMAGWRPKFAEGLRYFDTVAQATRVKCPVKIQARLGDYVCPPSTTTTLYNCFSGIKAIDFLQSGTHGYHPPEIEKSRLRYDPANPTGEIKLGKYRHYKGGEYEVIGIGFDSENLEDTVIYRSLENGNLWVRPKWMFEEYVSVAELPVKRFEYLD